MQFVTCSIKRGKIGFIELSLILVGCIKRVSFFVILSIVIANNFMLIFVNLLKMMECATCKHWVHAKCESLSNEKYEVLSTLPEFIEYVCK